MVLCRAGLPFPLDHRGIFELTELSAMIVQAGFVGVLMFSVGLGSVLAQEQPAPKHETASTPGVPPVASREANPDAPAIGDLLGRFIKAYNARDAKALGELFTPEAEIEDDDGAVTR